MEGWHGPQPSEVLVGPPDAPQSPSLPGSRPLRGRGLVPTAAYMAELEKGQRTRVFGRTDVQLVTDAPADVRKEFQEYVAREHRAEQAPPDMAFFRLVFLSLLFSRVHILHF